MVTQRGGSGAPRRVARILQPRSPGNHLGWGPHVDPHARRAQDFEATLRLDAGYEKARERLHELGR